MSVVCIGGSSVDRKYTALSAFQMGTSNPVKARRNFGGVARNVAENLARLGVKTALVSVVGNDENGVALIEHAQRAGIDTRLVLRDSAHVTPEYAALVDPSGELVIGVADMSAVDQIDIEDLKQRWEAIAQNDWIFADCNLSAEVLFWLVRAARDAGVSLAIDAVSEPKVCKLPDDLSGVGLLVLNEREAAVYLYEEAEAFAQIPLAARIDRLRECGAESVAMTLGARGVAVGGPGGFHHIRALAQRRVDETGASDALCAGMLSALQNRQSLLEGARCGALAAALTVESPATVRPDLSPSLLQVHAQRLEDACTAL